MIDSSSALRALQATSQAMLQSQTRIATGFKINQASDNPTAWTAATQIRGTIKSNEAYKVGLADAQTQAKLTTNALSQLSEGLRNIRTKLDEWAVADAASNTAKKTAIENEISNLQNDVTQAVKSAKYNGTNWLDTAANATITVASGASAKVTITNGASQISGSGSLLAAADIGASASYKTLLNFTSTEIASSTYRPDITNKLTAAITAVEAAQTTYGAAAESIDSRTEFLTGMNDILSSQLSSLVDADLNEESAKLSALQVRQQLAMTALQIANQSQLNILRLFQ